MKESFFYDQNLRLIPNYTTIDWGDGIGNFGTQAKHSQLVYYISKLNFGINICLINNGYDQSLINNSNIDLVIINVSDHPVSEIKHINLNIPYIVLGSNFNLPNYHPYHLLFSSYLSLNETIKIDSKRKHYVSCVNRSPRITRIYNLHELRKNSNYNDFKVKWFKLSESNGPVPDINDIVETLGKDVANSFMQYEKEYPEYTIRTEYQLCSGIDDFIDSYLNIVTESRLEDIGFLTEKTFKPIRAGQLFLMQGPPGTINFLRNIGFDTFDDLIDHSYDTEPNWKTRTDLMLNELDKIYNHIESFYFQTIDRRKNNQLHLRSTDLINSCLSNIRYNHAIG